MNRNLVLTLGLDVPQAPTRTAIITETRALTYEQLSDESARLASALLEAGVRMGDSVLFWAANRAEHVTVFLACARIGAIFAPVHPTFGQRELAYIAEIKSPALTIVETKFLDAYMSAVELGNGELPRAPIVIDDGTSPASTHGVLEDFDTWRMDRAVAEIRTVEGNTPTLVYFSSGTTSNPKPILMSHDAQTWNAQTYAAVQGYQPDDVVLDTMPLSWAYGLSTVMMPMLYSGGTVIVQERFKELDALQLIRDHGVTLFPGTATMFSKLLKACNGNLDLLSPIREMYLGGEPRNERTIAALEEWLEHPVIEQWALSEAHPVTSTGHLPYTPHGSIGKPVPGAEVRIVDFEGQEVSGQTPGEAWIRCPGQMLEYLGEPGLTAEKLTPEGWLRTGDVLRRDENGFLYIVGRMSNMIIRGGTNIAPAEIEDALRETDGIIDAGVVGIPDAAHGESVVALVIVSPGKTIAPEEIRQLLRGRLASYKIPQHVHIVDELPVVASGKKSISALREAAIKLTVGVTS